MHLIFMVRGLLQQVRLFEKFMETQMFPWKRINLKTGETEVVQVQGGLRTLPFGYEYIFPEECLDEVLTMLDAEALMRQWNIGKLKTSVLRMMIGSGRDGDKILPIPKDYVRVPTNRYIEKRGMAIYLIGIKKDRREAVEEWGYEQELL